MQSKKSVLWTWMLVNLIASVTMAQHSGSGNGKISGLVNDSISGGPLEYATSHYSAR